jgi:hypothetical protein
MFSKTSTVIFSFCVFLFSSSFSSCGSAEKDGKKDSTTSANANKPIPDNMQKATVSHDFEMIIPKHFTVTSDLNKEAVLQYNDTANEEYIIVLEEPKADFVRNLKEMNLYDEKETPEKNYRMAEIQIMSKGMLMKEGPNIKKTAINGLDAEMIDMLARIDTNGTDIFYKAAFIEGPKNMYMIMSWTLADSKDKNSAEMETMLNSFKAIE